MRDADHAADLPTDLPTEFHGPIDFSGLWAWVAAAALLLVVAYYVAAFLATRPVEGTTVSDPEDDGLRAAYLDRIDTLVAAVHAGEISPRTGHQRLSLVLRHFAETMTALPVTRMSLADVRVQAPALAPTLALLYPPEFAPDPEFGAETDAESFERAAAQARALITGWGAEHGGRGGGAG